MNILIAGGSGLVGRHLTSFLEEKKLNVAWLSRSQQKDHLVFQWDPSRGFVDAEAIQWADVIINLAGANIAGKRWSKAYKQQLLESRILAANCLAKELTQQNKRIHVYVGASAIGYYGAYDSDHEAFGEESGPGQDVLSVITKKWESAHGLVPADRMLTFRFGIVFTRQGGALEKIVKPIRFGLGACVGDGRAVMSWIHIDDLCHMMYQSIMNEQWHGVYNAVSPEPVSNKTLTQTIAKVLKRPLWLPSIPPVVLELMLGEFGKMAALGTNVSSMKVEKEGFVFRYDTLLKAISNLLS